MRPRGSSLSFRRTVVAPPHQIRNDVGQRACKDLESRGACRRGRRYKAPLERSANSSRAPGYGGGPPPPALRGSRDEFGVGSWPMERLPQRLKKLRPRKHQGEGWADRVAAAGAAVREPHGRGSGRWYIRYDGSDGPEAGGDRLLVPAAGSAPRPPRTSAEPAAPKSRRVSGRVRNARKVVRTHRIPVAHLWNDHWSPPPNNFTRVLHGLAAPDGSAPGAGGAAPRARIRRKVDRRHLP